MRSNPNTNRQQAAEQLVEAAGGKLISVYGTMRNGPGVMAIFDVPDPAMGPAISVVGGLPKPSVHASRDNAVAKMLRRSRAPTSLRASSLLRPREWVEVRASHEAGTLTVALREVQPRHL